MVHIKRILVSAVLCLSICLLPALPASAQPPPRTDIPSAAQEGEAIRKVKPFKAAKPLAPKEDIEREEELQAPSGEAEEKKFLIERVIVEGNTVLPESLLSEIVSQYEHKELSLSDLIGLADKITDLYHSKGHITSQSYVPPQTIKDNTVTIKVLEGKYGYLYIEGAVHSNEAIIKRRMKRKENEVLSYDELKNDLLYLGRNPDRMVRAVLTRGEEEGTTDTIVKVKDRPPVHAFTSYDNTGNRTTGNWRLTLGLQDTSLLGWDDEFMLRWIRSDTYNLYGWIGNYTVPVNEFDAKLGVTASYFKSKIGGDFQDSHIESWSRTFSPFIESPIFENKYSTGTLKGTLNLGLDAKTARTEIASAQDSRDTLRIARGTFTLDESDSAGRTIVTNTLNFSQSHFLGSMDENAPGSSRERGSGKFIKYNYSITRINPLFLSTLLLLTIEGQATNNPLVSSEQYRIGGMYDVRGYAEGDALGDYGTNASAELRYPYYFIPDDFHIMGFHPRRALQGTAFIDWGFAHFNDPTTADRNNSNLVGAGFGGRLDFMSTLQGRYDIAWPMGDSSTYGRAPKAHMALSFQEPTMQEYERLLEEMMHTRINDKLKEVKSLVPDDMKELYEQAKGLEEQGQYEEAKGLYAKVVEMRDQIVFGAQTEINTDIETEREARAAFEEARKYHREGDLDKALEAYRKVTELAEERKGR